MEHNLQLMESPYLVLSMPDANTILWQLFVNLSTVIEWIIGSACFYFTPYSLVKSTKSANNKARRIIWSPVAHYLAQNLLMLLFLLHFKSMFVLFPLGHYHMKMNNNKKDLTGKIILTLLSSIFYIQIKRKFDTWDMRLYKHITYYLNASVSEELRDKWHAYNYPSTINKLQISIYSQRQRKFKSDFMKFQKLHIHKFVILTSETPRHRSCLQILFTWREFFICLIEIQEDHKDRADHQTHPGFLSLRKAFHQN